MRDSQITMCEAIFFHQRNDMLKSISISGLWIKCKAPGESESISLSPSDIAFSIGTLNAKLCHETYSPILGTIMLQRNSTAKRKRSGDLDVEIKCYMIMQPTEKDEFFQSIKQLYQSESLCDVSFKIGDSLFPVHRVILAAANRYRARQSSGFDSLNYSINCWMSRYIDFMHRW